VGWAFGVEAEGMAEAEQDTIEAEQLYEVLERAVIPLYYDRGSDGVPHGWIAMVKQSMRKLCPRFNANRMVRQYVEEHYLPAAHRYHALASDHLARAKALAGWEAAVGAHWSEVRIEEAGVEEENGALHFRAHVRLGALRPEDVTVQIFADPRDGARPELQPMTPKAADSGAYCYEGQVPALRPPGDYTIRLLPRHPDAHQPLDLPLVLWEH
jgi:starch phosphorylase